MKVGGFYTEERRGTGNKRTGFDVVSFCSEGEASAVRGVLASVAPVIGCKAPAVGLQWPFPPRRGERAAPL